MELSEEEKKAINFIKEVIEFWLDKDKSYVFGTDYEKENLKIILNLIDNQQKEIENSISKDKIRELLEEHRCTGYYEVEHVLEELLDEGDHIPRID